MKNKLEIAIKILYYFLIYLAAQFIFIILFDTVSGHVTNQIGNYKILGLIILLIVSLKMIINRINIDKTKPTNFKIQENLIIFLYYASIILVIPLFVLNLFISASGHETHDSTINILLYSSILTLIITKILILKNNIKW